MAKRIRIEGMYELSGQIRELAKGLPPDKVENIMLKGAEIVRDRAIIKARPHRRTGLLESNIIVKVLKRIRDKPAPAIAAVDEHPLKGAPHAHLLEYGTCKQPAYPFFRPAVEETSAQVLNYVMSELEDSINRMVDNL